MLIFKYTKRFIRVNAVPIFTSVFMLMVQGNAIRCQNFMMNESHVALESIIKSFNATIEARGMEGPEVLYSDLCCKERAFYVILTSC